MWYQAEKINRKNKVLRQEKFLQAWGTQEKTSLPSWCQTFRVFKIPRCFKNSMEFRCANYFCDFKQIYYRYWLSPPSEIVIDILMSISRVLDLELNISVMSPNILLEKKKKKKNQAQKVSGLSAITHPVAQSTNLKCIFHFFCFLPMSHASSPSYKSCSSLSILTIVQTAFSSQFTHGISHSCFPSRILNLKPSEWSLKNVITTCQVYVSKLPKVFP